jgi:hypothetical protein
VVAGAFFALCAGVTIADDYSTNRHEVNKNPQWEFLIILKTNIEGKQMFKSKIYRSKSKFNDNKKREILC